MGYALAKSLFRIIVDEFEWYFIFLLLLLFPYKIRNILCGTRTGIERVRSPKPMEQKRRKKFVLKYFKMLRFFFFMMNHQMSVKFNEYEEKNQWNISAVAAPNTQKKKKINKRIINNLFTRAAQLIVMVHVLQFEHLFDYA